MKEHNDQNNKLSKDLKSAFSELEIIKHLRRVGITIVYFF